MQTGGHLHLDKAAYQVICCKKCSVLGAKCVQREIDMHIGGNTHR